MKWEREIDVERLPMLEMLARAGAARAPEAPEAWLRLGELQGMLGRAEAGDSFDKAAALASGDPMRLLSLAGDFARLNERDRALAAVDAALALAPDDAHARTLKLRSLFMTHRYPEARRLIEDGETVDLGVRGVLAMHEDAGTAPERLLALCAQVLETQPRNAEAHFYRALSLARLGRRDEACAVVDLDRLVRTLSLPAPPSFADGEAFRAALAAEVLANPTQKHDPGYRSTQQGRQVARLEQPGTRAVPALLRQIEKAVDAYIADLPDAPARAKLHSWAVILGGDGFQRSHYHPTGWLSGVYYVAAPRPAGANTYPGRLIVGALKEERAALQAAWGTREIEPVPGRLVLFPSYIPHATEPSGIDADRISIAFDVMPVD
ncbi:MAG: putative 2OG-Fe(II) oxygenase [Rhizomicrobium sp.]